MSTDMIDISEVKNERTKLATKDSTVADSNPVRLARKQTLIHCSKWTDNYTILF